MTRLPAQATERRNKVRDVHTFITNEHRERPLFKPQMTDQEHTHAIEVSLAYAVVTRELIRELQTPEERTT